MESVAARADTARRGHRRRWAPPGSARQRVLAVLGSSAALGDHLVRAPRALVGGHRGRRRCPSGSGYRRLVTAVTAPGTVPAADVLRTAYREQLLGIAALDLTSPDPIGHPPRDGQRARRPGAGRARGGPGHRPRGGGAGCRPHAPRRHRDGQDRGVRAELHLRRRRHLRRRAGRRGARGGVDGHRHRPRDPADADLLGVDAGRLAVAGRPRAAPRGQERAARAHRREPPRLLRALGQDLGVPGAAQGARRRGRPRGGAGLLRRGAADGVAGLEPRELRRRRAGDAPPGRAAHPRRPRPTASSSSAPVGCATSSSRCSCSSSCTVGPTSRCAPAPRSTGWPRCPPGATWGARTPRRSARHTGCCARWSTASSCSGCGART